MTRAPMDACHDHDENGAHDHVHSEVVAGASPLRPLGIALAITAGFMAIEAIGGWLTNSLALLADAGHMATDVIALGLSVFAVWIARRPATPARSFGYLRSEVLAAFVNSVALIAISLIVFWEAFQRIANPPDVDSGPMIVVASAGLIANLASARILSSGGGHQHNLNTRGALLHVIGDALGSIGAIVAAVIMLATGWYLADPVLSGGIGLLILWNSWRLLRESLDVLMESTPENIDARAVGTAAMSVEGVTGVHDLHIWTVTSGLVAASAHIQIDDFSHWMRILPDLDRIFADRFGIAHVTLQPEPANGPRTRDDACRCSLDSGDGRAACLVAVGKRPFVRELSHAGHHH